MEQAVVETQTPEQVAQDTQDSQAAFDAAFDAPVTKTDAKPEPVEQKVEAAPEVIPESQPQSPLIAGMTEDELKATLGKVSAFDARLGQEVQRVFSKIGEVQRTVQELQKAAASGGGKSTRQITPAMLKRVNDELPGFGEALAADLNEAMFGPEATAEAQQAKAAAEAKGQVFDADKYFAEKLAPVLNDMQKRASEEQSRMTTELRQYARLDAKHEGWEDTINTPAFATWAFAGGPTEAERAQQRQLQASDANAYAANQAALVQKYPQWWAAKGHLINSDKATDAIKLLDEFKSSGKPKPSGQKSRLEAAIPAKGTSGGENRQTETDRDAAQRAFDAQFE